MVGLGTIGVESNLIAASHNSNATPQLWENIISTQIENIKIGDLRSFDT